MDGPSLSQAGGSCASLEDRHDRACHQKAEHRILGTTVRHKSKDLFLHLPKVCQDKHQRDRSCCWCQCCRNIPVQVKLQKLMGTYENNPTLREVGHLKVNIRNGWLLTLGLPCAAQKWHHKQNIKCHFGSFWVPFKKSPSCAHLPSSWLIDAGSFPGPVLPGHSQQRGCSMGSMGKGSGSYQHFSVMS